MITDLSTIDELGQRDISIVAEDVDILELAGSVPESDAEEVTDIRGRAAAELDSHGRGEVGYQEMS